METRRYDEDEVAHRHVLHLGELNDSQRAAWQRTLDVVDERTGESRQMALYPRTAIPADRAALATSAQIEALQVRLDRPDLSCPQQ